MKKITELSNRVIRDSWLQENGGRAVKEGGVWYWIPPEKKEPKKETAEASRKKTKKKLF